MAKKEVKKVRGIYEKVPGSGVWWTRHHDAHGRLRREKAGTPGMAVKLYQKRKVQALQRKKLPETLRRREVLLSELLADAAEHIRQHYHGQRLGADKKDYRYATLKGALGSHPAESVTAQEIERALSRLATARKWEPASFNRHKAFLSLAYRLGIEGEKVQSNPIRLVHRRRENNGRIRWLTADEEKKLRAVIQSNYPGELSAFALALHTGMRRSEQYGLTWDCVDFVRRQITIPRSKNGGIRYIPLDNTAVEALLALRKRGNGSGPVMVSAESGHGHVAGQPLKTPREWFATVCEEAGISDFTWHCLRHTFASRLVMAGVGLRTVQELMGHKTIAMTCRYAHLAPQHQLDAVSKLDGWGRESSAETDTKTDTSEFEPVEATPVENVQPTLQ
ncbi:MAG: site-specific integrase [Acidobacteria bacterium]|nr:site-specific integrase [Acidobacteriota bacterium]